MSHGLFSDTRTVRRAFRSVLVLTLLAALCAGLVVTVVNDVYAFIKPQKPLRLSIDEPLSLRAFCDLLGEHEVVQNPFLFGLYVRMRGKVEIPEGFVGELLLDSSMSYREILQAMSQTSASSAE